MHPAGMYTCSLVWSAEKVVLLEWDFSRGLTYKIMSAKIRSQLTYIIFLLHISEHTKGKTSDAPSALPAAQPLSDRWTFLRTTAVQDSSISKAVPDKPMAAVSQETLSELLMHLKVFNVDWLESFVRNKNVNKIPFCPSGILLTRKDYQSCVCGWTLLHMHIAHTTFVGG